MPVNRTLSRFGHTMIFGRKSSVETEQEQWKSGGKCGVSMRQSFQRALTTCGAPLPPGKKYVAVRFLNRELIFYVVDTKGKGQEIFDEASKHLGLSDAELFGLAFYQDGEYIFIDLNLKVSKYAVRSWKTQTNGISGDGQPLLILHMRIKYYVDCHLLINEKAVRHNYYLQLRENIKHYSQPISQEKAFLLAALALQADLGNYNAEKHKNRYFEIANYFPPWMIKKIGEDFIVQSVPALHRDNVGLSRGEAQVGFIRGASEPTAPHNMHLYKMRRKKGKVWGDAWIGVGDSGIHIYEEVERMKSLLSTFSWCDIAKLHFEKKKFEILSEGSPEYRRFTYFVQSEESAKHLLWLCRITHHFHMANQAKVADLKKMEMDGGKPYREAYIYTDKVDQAREKKQNTLQRSTWNSDTEPTTRAPFNDQWEQQSDPHSSHHSMDALPLTKSSRFSSELKYKSQSIPCLPAPYSAAVDISGHPWSPAADSTLRSSRTSNTGSSSSRLSTTSGWLKCDSFEELPIERPIHPQVCISTFSDKHVRTASVYNTTDHFDSHFPAQRNNTGHSCTASSPTQVSTVLNSCFPNETVEKNNNCIPARRSSVHNTQVSPTSNTAFTVSSLTVLNSCFPNEAVEKNNNCIPARMSSSTTGSPTQMSDNNDRAILSSGDDICSPTQMSETCESTIRNNRIPTYNTSSLESPSSSKLVDVKRSPSCAGESRTKKATPAKPPRHCIKDDTPSKTLQQRHYVANTHGRTTPRIGVSSLSRDQRLPLTLFNDCGIVACGSEPNLYAPVNKRNSMAMSAWFQRKLNSQSEMSLNVLDSRSEPSFGREVSESQQSGVRNEVAETDFPFIPPPPAYRNEIGNEVADDVVKPPVLQIQEKATPVENPQPDERSLDIHQLRQRSDIPLISALCNDRSLLMLPKTVPTCSRQRHLGTGRTTSLPEGEISLVKRPISWHVDSSRVSHWPEVSKPCSASWDCSSGQREASNVLVSPRSGSMDQGMSCTLGPRIVSLQQNAVPCMASLSNGMPSQSPRQEYNGQQDYLLQHSDIQRVDHGMSCTLQQNAGLSNMSNGMPSQSQRQEYTSQPDYLVQHSGIPRMDNEVLASGMLWRQNEDRPPDYNDRQDYLRPRTVSLDKSVPMNLNQYMLASKALGARTISLENGIHRGVCTEVRTIPYLSPSEAFGKRTISLDNGIQVSMDHPHYMLNSDARMISTVHRGTEIQSHRATTSMDYSNYLSEPMRPRTVSLENGIYQPAVQRTQLLDRPLVAMASLPPTILTSFVKTPSRQVRDQTDSYRCDKSQMIPTKLLASGIANGRLYHKGLSS